MKREKRKGRVSLVDSEHGGQRSGTTVEPVNRLDGRYGCRMRLWRRRRRRRRRRTVNHRRRRAQPGRDDRKLFRFSRAAPTATGTGRRLFNARAAAVLDVNQLFVHLFDGERRRGRHRGRRRRRRVQVRRFGKAYHFGGERVEGLLDGRLVAVPVREGRVQGRRMA